MEQIELIKEIKNNNSNAYTQLQEQFKKMIHSILNDYELEYGDYKINRDDLLQEAFIALYDAALSFDETKNSKFSTFAYVVIKRRINRFYKAYKRRYLYETWSIDDLEYGDHSTILETPNVSDNESDYSPAAKLDEIIKKKKLKLTEEDRAIIMMRIEKCSYAEIAKKLKINKKRIDNRLSRLRREYSKS